MIETPHSLLGAAVGAATGNPAWAVPAGIASHWAGDILPHWNPQPPFRGARMYAFVIADFVVALGLVVAFWLFFPDRPEVAVGAFCGVLPDLILAVRHVLKQDWLAGYERIHNTWHHEVPLRAGWWPQVVVSLVSIWYLVRI